MEQNTSYKKMLRDRCPKTVNLALKWCKAKEKWLNHVYKNQIWILSNKKERLNQTKAILGKQTLKKDLVFIVRLIGTILQKLKQSIGKMSILWLSSSY